MTCVVSPVEVYEWGRKVLLKGDFTAESRQLEHDLLQKHDHEEELKQKREKKRRDQKKADEVTKAHCKAWREQRGLGTRENVTYGS